ncbi:MAG TPA: 30S ribosomal protein S2 [archaeon]|nr:30S ribosomal protein S2 [archaeon]
MNAKKKTENEAAETAVKEHVKAEQPVQATPESHAKSKAAAVNAEQYVEKRESKPERKGQLDENELKHTKLVETERYLNTGSHIGTKFKSGEMRRYIYKVRKDGLNVLDVQVIDDRLAAAAKMLAKFKGEKIAVVSRKSYGQTPAKAFAEAVGAKAITGRFIPGTFSNPQCTRYVEPRVIMVTDPEYDFQAIEEATRVRIPVVAMASTNNALKNIDLAVPVNNKGRKSLALAYWILAKEVLKARDEIKSDSEFTKTADDFEYKMKEGEEEEQRRNFERSDRKGGFGKDRGRGDSRGGGRFGGRGGGRSGGFGGGRSFDRQERQFPIPGRSAPRSF